MWTGYEREDYVRMYVCLYVVMYVLCISACFESEERVVAKAPVNIIVKHKLDVPDVSTAPHTKHMI
jgi:hypothetical protein